MSAVVAADLAARINEHHREAHRQATAAIEHARQAGELLIQAKESLAHGEWLPWLEANCEVGEREAQRYMRVARQWHELKSDTMSDLSLTGALNQLSGEAKEFDVEQFFEDFGNAFDVLRNDGQCWTDPDFKFKGKRHLACFSLADRMTTSYYREGIRPLIHKIGEAQGRRDYDFARAMTAVLEAWEPADA